MIVDSKWDDILSSEYKQDYFKKLVAFVRDEYKNKIIYPKAEDVFNALRYTNYDDVKVVILGQDPYINKGEAHGLSFSVQEGVKLPPSLQNIFKELDSDLGIKRTKGDLSDWAKQGILLLNASLTVEGGKANSHKNKGWEIFTDAIIKKLNEKETPIVFILWGNNARSKKHFITNPIHLVIESTHPSPFAYMYGFKGSKPFSKTNDFLRSHNMEEIKW